jgi:hypothetical protein
MTAAAAGASMHIQAPGRTADLMKEYGIVRHDGELLDRYGTTTRPLRVWKAARCELTAGSCKCLVELEVPAGTVVHLPDFYWSACPSCWPKARAEVARVLRIECLRGLHGSEAGWGGVQSATSAFDPTFRYELSKTVSPRGAPFDRSAQNDTSCKPGIHFFFDRSIAAAWADAPD